MKRTRSLIIAAAVLVLLIVGTVVVKKVEKHVDSINTIDETIISLSQDNIEKVKWVYSDETLTFEKQDGEWADPEDSNFPVDQDKMEKFLDNFEDVHASFIIEDVEDFGQYGLDMPEAVITFTLADSELEVKLGDFSVMDSKRYVSIGDGKVYLIDTDLLEDISVERDSFILNDKLTDLSQVTNISVTGESSAEIVYDEENYYTYTNFYNYYLHTGDEYKPLSEASAKDFIENITDLSLKTFATYTASSEDLSKYGLDNPAFKVTVTGEKKTDSDSDTVETASYIVNVGYVIDTDTKVEEGEEPAKLVYVRVGDSEIIYSVDQSVYDTLVADEYKDLRPATVLYVQKDDIKSVGTTLENTEISIEYEASEDKDSKEDAGDFYLNGYTVALDDLVSALNDLNVKDSDASKKSTVLELETNINVNTDKYSEVNLKIYRYDGDYCYVELNGEAVGLIERSKMVAVKENVMKLLLNLGKEEKAE